MESAEAMVAGNVPRSVTREKQSQMASSEGSTGATANNNNNTNSVQNKPRLLGSTPKREITSPEASGEPQHQCEVCHLTFKSKEVKDFHESLHYNSGDGCEDEVEENGLCPPVDTKPDVPQQTPENYCKLCNETFDDVKEWRAHIKEHQNPPCDEPLYDCSICGKGFEQRKELRLHQKLHTKTVKTKKFCGGTKYKKATLALPHSVGTKRKADTDGGQEGPKVKADSDLTADQPEAIAQGLGAKKARIDTVLEVVTPADTTTSGLSGDETHKSGAKRKADRGSYPGLPMDGSNEGGCDEMSKMNSSSDLSQEIPPGLGAKRQNNIDQSSVPDLSTPKKKKIVTERKGRVKQNLVQCHLCSKRYSSKKNLQRHVSIIHNRTQFTCTSCGKHLESEYELIKHKLIKHPLSFTTRPHLQQLKLLSTKRTIRNQLSGRKDPTTIATSRKVPGHGSLSNAAAHKQADDQCDESYDNRALHSLSRPKEDGHVHGPPYKCSSCGKGYSTRGNLIVHIKHVHPNKPKLKCDLCPQTFYLEPGLEKHKQKVHQSGEMGHQCPACDKCFGKKRSLLYHVKGVHRNLPKHECDVCRQAFWLQSSLSRHKHMSHNSTRTNQAATHKQADDQYDESNNDKAPDRLSRHKEDGHIRDPPYKCSSCGKVYSMRCNLIRHIRQDHPNQPKVKCDLCPEKFYLESDLEKHKESVHQSGQTGYQCPACDKCFGKKCYLLYHVRHIHPNRPKHECDECSQTFRLESSLSRHKHISHNSTRTNQAAAHKQAEDQYDERNNDKAPHHSSRHKEDGQVHDPPYKCLSCRKVYSIRRSLVRHIRQDHPNQPKVKCDLCPEKFYLESDLEKHKESVHQSGQTGYQCPACGKCFGKKRLLLAHLMHIHPNQPKNKCDICSRTFWLESSLSRHKHISHNSKHTNQAATQKQADDQCDESNNDKAPHSLSRPSEDGHVRDPPYKCSSCGNVYSSSCSLVRHIQQAHPNQPKQKCNLCPQEFWLESSIRRHKQSAHQNGQMGHQCSECDKCFGKKANLLTHLWRNHRNQTKNKCDICSQTFWSESSLTTHKRKIHKIHDIPRTNYAHNSSYKCSSCGKGYSTRANLIQHIQRAHPNKPKLKCDLCPQKFYLESALEKHKQKVHQSGQRSHQCLLCEKVYSIKCNLTTHIRLAHPNEPKQKCNLCPREFYLKSDLEKHQQKVHQSGQKGHQCPACDKCFREKRSLFHHIKHIHPNLPKVSCDICNKTFRLKSSLERHKYRVHKSLHKKLTTPSNAKKSSETRSDASSETELEVPLPKHPLTSCQSDYPHPSKVKCNTSGKELLSSKLNCEKCNQEFSTQEAVDQHNCADLYACDLCNKDRKTQDGLSVHQQQCLPSEVRVKDSTFGKQTNTKLSAESTCPSDSGSTSFHKSRGQPCSVSQDLNPLQCVACSKSFKSQKSLALHMHNVHPELLGFKCEFCTKAFFFEHTFTSHLQKVHNYQPPMEDDPGTCDVCGKLFPSEDDMVKHMWEEHLRSEPETSASASTDLPKSCSPSKTSDSIETADTSKSSHPPKTFSPPKTTCASNSSCQSKTCGPLETAGTPKTKISSKTTGISKTGKPSVTTGPSDTTALTQTTSPSKTTMHQQQLATDHLTEINRPYPQQCTICSKTLHTQIGLLKHMRNTHTERLTFKCQLCDKIFFLKHTLERHQKDAHGYLMDRPEENSTTQSDANIMSSTRSHVTETGDCDVITPDVVTDKASPDTLGDDQILPEKDGQKSYRSLPKRQSLRTQNSNLLITPRKGTVRTRQGQTEKPAEGQASSEDLKDTSPANTASKTLRVTIRGGTPDKRAKNTNDITSTAETLVVECSENNKTLKNSQGDSVPAVPAAKTCQSQPKNPDEPAVGTDVRQGSVKPEDHTDKTGPEEDWPVEDSPEASSGEEVEDADEEVPQCDVCGITLPTQDEVVTHIMEAHFHTYTCDVCQKTFKQKINMKLHKKKMHLTKGTFKCSICDKTFSTKWEKKVHECCTDSSTNKGEETQQVNDRSLLSKDETEQPKRRKSSSAEGKEQDDERSSAGSEKKRFQCSHCDKSFSRKDAVQRHFKSAHVGYIEGDQVALMGDKQESSETEPKTHPPSSEKQSISEHANQHGPEPTASPENLKKTLASSETTKVNVLDKKQHESGSSEPNVNFTGGKTAMTSVMKDDVKGCSAKPQEPSVSLEREKTAIVTGSKDGVNGHSLKPQEPNSSSEGETTATVTVSKDDVNRHSAKRKVTGSKNGVDRRSTKPQEPNSSSEGEKTATRTVSKDGVKRHSAKLKVTGSKDGVDKHLVKPQEPNASFEGKKTVTETVSKDSFHGHSVKPQEQKSQSVRDEGSLPSHSNGRPVTETAKGDDVVTEPPNQRGSGINKETVTNNYIFHCAICGEDLPTEQALERHEEEVHLRQSSCICNMCGREFWSEDDLVRHMRLTHAHKPKHRCGTCGRQFVLEYSLVRHQCGAPAHQTLYDCPGCTETFADEEALGSHKCAPPPSAPVSGTVTAGKRILGTMVLQYEPEAVDLDRVKVEKDVDAVHDPLQCDLCGMAFHSTTDLHKHKAAVHMNQHPFTCSICDEGFMLEQSLAKHKREVHFQQGLYKCLVCGMEFARREEQYQHQCDSGALNENQRATWLLNNPMLEDDSDNQDVAQPSNSNPTGTKNNRISSSEKRKRGGPSQNDLQKSMSKETTANDNILGRTVFPGPSPKKKLKVKLYSCSVCRHAFRSPEQLESHMSVHPMEKDAQKPGSDTSKTAVTTKTLDGPTLSESSVTAEPEALECSIMSHTTECCCNSPMSDDSDATVGYEDPRMCDSPVTDNCSYTSTNPGQGSSIGDQNSVRSASPIIFPLEKPKSLRRNIFEKYESRMIQPPNGPTTEPAVASGVNKNLSTEWRSNLHSDEAPRVPETQSHTVPHQPETSGSADKDNLPPPHLWKYTCPSCKMEIEGSLNLVMHIKSHKVHSN